MNIISDDCAFLAVRLNHIARQLRANIIIDYKLIMAHKATYYITIVNNNNMAISKSFNNKNKIVTVIIDEIFEYCIDNDLFEIPLSININ